MSDTLQLTLDLERGVRRGKCIRLGVSSRQLSRVDIWLLRRAVERGESVTAKSNEGCVNVKVLSHDQVLSHKIQETFVLEACPMGENCSHDD